MTPEEKAVIEAAIAWNYPSGKGAEDAVLTDAVCALEQARENGQRIEHPFQPHHLAGSTIEPFDDYCTEAMRSESLRSWYTCGRPRAEHAS